MFVCKRWDLRGLGDLVSFEYALSTLQEVVAMWLLFKAEDILSPDCRRLKRSTSKIQKEYSDDGLSGYTVSSLKAVRHRYILFVFMVCSVSIPPAVRA